MASFALVRKPDSRSSIQTSIKTSIDDLNALETFASMVTTLPNGTERLKATWFTEAVTTILREWRRAAMLAARSIRAKSSPPKRLLIGLVSLGSTKSVMMVFDCSGVFACIIRGFLLHNVGIAAKIKRIKDLKYGTSSFKPKIK